MNTDTIAVTVNGEHQQLAASHSIASLLTYLKLPADRVAVELDKMLVRKREWTSTSVNDGARLEIVEFVGGG